MLNWWKDLRIGSKLLLSFTCVTCLTLVVSGVAYLSARRLEILGDEALTQNTGMREVMQCSVALFGASREVSSAILATSEAEVRRRTESVRRDDAAFRASFEAYQKTITEPATREQAQQVFALYEKHREVQDEVLRRALVQHDAEAVAHGDQAQALATQLEAGLEALVKHQAELQEKNMVVQDAAAASAMTLSLVLAVIVSLLAFGLGFIITRYIAGALSRTMETAELAASGDLTVRVPVTGKDEFGRTADALNRFFSHLHDSMTQVAQSSEAVSTSSRELSASAQNISSGAQEQASSLEETAASLEEMTSTVKQNADNAQQAAQLASGARDVAEKGGHVVGSAVAAMKEINAASRKIADIITAIDEIAFQTNLLALNAAVEAARAGEQGRGFAVVAGEVRNLAQRSASAAKEIKGLIQDSVEKVESGSLLVNQSGQTLDEIVLSVKKVTEIISEIAAASREQSTGVDQVNVAVGQMDSVTQSNASQTEEMAGTAESLASQAQQLRAMVEQFKLDRTANARAAAAAVTASRHSAPASKQSTRAPQLRSVPGRAAQPAAHAGAKTGTHDGFEEF